MSKIILSVEDSEDDVLFLKRAFKKAEITEPLQVVSDGRAAVQYLEGEGKFTDREQFPLPSLILLDLKLPQMPGFEVLKWIRSQPAHQTYIVVVFTSSDLEEDKDRAYRLGANSYLVKTASADELLAMVKLIQQYWLKLNACPPESAWA